MKKDRVSLQVVAFNSILFFSIALILVIGAVTLINNFFTTMKSYKRETAHNMEYAVSLIGTSYLEKVYEKTRQKYESAPSGVEDQFSDEYIYHFADIIDDDFWNARDIIVLCREKNHLDSIALFFPDVERQRAVFVIDGYELEDAYVPGQWLSTEDTDIDTPEEMERVASSNVILHVGHGELNGWIATNYIKVFDSAGDFLGYCTCDVDITDFFNRLIGSAIIYIIVFVAFVAFMAYRISRLLKKRIINPINSLAYAAEEYTKRDKTALEDEKSFFENLHIDTNDEIETLYRSLSDMEADINSTMKRIRDMTAEKERAAAEMNLAGKIQSSMLKATFPMFPGRDDFDIYASMDPAKEVGGDFYDAFLIDDEHLGLVIADVSGKGVPAALFMAISMTVIRERARRGGTPSHILYDANNTLYESNSAMMFVTVWLAILNLTTGELIEANAGHEKPVFIKANGECELIKKEHGVVLGIMEGLEQKDEYYTLAPGDKIFVYTDGLPEATNAEEKRLEEPRMFEIIEKYRGDDNETLLKDIRKEVDDFVKDAPQFDDLTMMVVEYKGPKGN